MRKFVGILISIVCLITMSSCGLIMNGIWSLFGEKKTYKEIVGERLSVDLSSAKVLEEWDTHGGFHGDGESFLKMSVPNDFEEKLDIGEVVDGKAGDGWYAMPFTGTVYEYYYEWGGLFEHPETREKVIPEIANGYWKFTSEQSGFNWELAVLDADADILYYYEFDS